MDSSFNEFTNFVNGFKTEGEIFRCKSYKAPSPSNYGELDQRYLDISFLDSPSYMPPRSDSGSFVQPFNLSPDGGPLNAPAGLSSEEKSPLNSEDVGLDDYLLKYINQMLMEENMEDQPYMFHDAMALKEVEKSLYEVLGKPHPSLASQSDCCPNQNLEGPSSFYSFNSTDFPGKSTSNTRTSNITDSRSLGDVEVYAPSSFPALYAGNYGSGSGPLPNSQTFFKPSNNFSTYNIGGLGSSVDSFPAQHMFSDPESILLFKKGLEEASKFVPDSSKLILNKDMGTTVSGPKKVDRQLGNKAWNGERITCSSGSRGKKNREREDVDVEEERSNKQSAVSFAEEGELSEMFDKVLLFQDNMICAENEAPRNDESGTILQKNEDRFRAGGGSSHIEKQGKKNRIVDLRMLLVLCAQAISCDDHETANKLLKQIRQHSPPLGDGSQRLAHYFANALEARLNGSGTGFGNFYTAQTFKWPTAASVLKAYQVYLSACPFKQIAIFLANKMILDVAEKATTLHIIEFGITYGFQWPLLIQFLSYRPGGPPKLRITGIEFPQHGFRPRERIEETGRRLAKYCERFNVPFEYNAVASQKWETIQIEDLKIRSSEVLAVNCLFRFKNLLDETVEANSPRDAVLKLIRKLNPSIFVHAVANGSHNAPFFIPRFKEALFYFSALFDMFDTTMGRECQERLMLEREFLARDAMNVIACEGPERVERPETYKQWQVRSLRAGFRQMPLDQELVKKFRTKMKTLYNKEFSLDEDGNWMLMGWRGRILIASSCWLPA